jgi:hypothetical protein
MRTPMKVMLPCAPPQGADPGLPQMGAAVPQLPQEPVPSQSRGLGSLFPPGLSAPPGTPSHGSALHAAGNCRPCAWYWKPAGCQNGESCGHCHLCPEGELKSRKISKVAMMRLGLATPKPYNDLVDLTAFFPAQEGACSGSEPDSTTCCSSPEQESLAPPSASDEEEILSSVIGCLGLEESNTRATTTRSSGRLPSSSFSMEPAPLLSFTPPGLAAPPNTPSYGSAAHAAGTCKPCAWFWKPSGCQNAQNCAYCHICSEGELKARKKTKHTAMRLGLVTPKAQPTYEQEARYALKLAACI